MTEPYLKKEVDDIKAKILNFWVRSQTLFYVKNYLAPIFSKMIFPFSKVIYLVSGINQSAWYFNGRTAQHLLAINEKIYDIAFISPLLMKY